MSNIVVPDSLFEREDLTLQAKWLYVLLARLCLQSPDGRWIGTEWDLLNQIKWSHLDLFLAKAKLIEAGFITEESGGCELDWKRVIHVTEEH